MDERVTPLGIAPNRGRLPRKVVVVMQGFMLDSARCLESRDYYRRFIRFAAEQGANTILWHFSDDQGCSLRLDSLPDAASPNAYTKAEIRELITYARDLGIELIPELASLGHTRFITRLPQYADLAEDEGFYSSICPCDPRTPKLLARLLAEVLEIFDAPLVHIGGDEVNIGHHPLTKRQLENRTTGELFAEHMVRLHEQVSAAGKRTMMWADQLLSDPTIAPLLPKDILMCNWQYQPGACSSTTKRLLDWGFEVVVCPALISHNQPIYPAESFAYPNVRAMAEHRTLSPRVIGMLTTIWTPTRFIADALWPAVHYAAAVMRDGPAVDPRANLADFGRTFYGLEPTDAWLDAMLRLQQSVPKRDAWAAVAQLSPTLTRTSTALRETASLFQSILANLLEARDSVQTNLHSYNRLLLLVEVLAHAWERAAAWQSGKLSPKQLQQSRCLMRRLSQAWDADRFADDPRKHDCSQLYDVADHLLLLLAEGTRVYENALSEPETEYVAGAAGR